MIEFKIYLLMMFITLYVYLRDVSKHGGLENLSNGEWWLIATFSLTWPAGLLLYFILWFNDLMSKFSKTKFAKALVKDL